MLETFTALLPLLLTLGASPDLPERSDLGVGQPRPWAQGVPQVRQAAASVHFQAGNAQLENSLFVKAVEAYTRALELWDHPSIHYNLALALVNLKEPLRLQRHLTQALRYGGQPLDAEKIARARDLLKLVEGQLVRVKISCSVPGASVRMNGQELFVAPGRYEDWVLPSEYIFTAVTQGYSLNERKRAPAAGQELTLDYRLYTQEALTREKRLWPAWKPWAVVGLGAALAGSGALFHRQALDRFHAYDDGIFRCSSAQGNHGCRPSQELIHERTRGESFQKGAIGAYALGSAALSLGLAFAYVNRVQTELLSPDEHERQLQASPSVDIGSRGAFATFRF